MVSIKNLSTRHKDKHELSVKGKKIELTLDELRQVGNEIELYRFNVPAPENKGGKHGK